jgi:aminoglycoside 3-N-acetyltransferase
MAVDYKKSDFVAALKTCGIRRGDVVFSHSNIGYFGRPEGDATSAAVCDLLVSAFRDVLGREGTLVVPTFTYSFGSDKVEKRFDPSATPSTCGMLTEYVRNQEGAERSIDPMFSVAAIGPDARRLTDNVGNECFGENSFWKRLLDSGGKICNLNCDAGSTFVHFVERRLGVPYRADRTFRGIVIENDREITYDAVFFSRRLEDAGAAAKFERFDERARAAGYVATAKVGRGAVVVISAEDTVRLIGDVLPSDPRFLTVGS